MTELELFTLLQAAKKSQTKNGFRAGFTLTVSRAIGGIFNVYHRGEVVKTVQFDLITGHGIDLIRELANG